jgi:hypothetical protein
MPGGAQWSSAVSPRAVGAWCQITDHAALRTDAGTVWAASSDDSLNLPAETEKPPA